MTRKLELPPMISTPMEIPNQPAEPASNELAKQWPELAGLIPQAREIKFPMEVLPKFLRDYVEEVAAVAELPVDVIAALSLSAVSAAVGGTIRIPGPGGGNRPCHIWNMLLGETRSGKSVALGLLIKPIRDAAKRSRELHKERARKQEAEMRRAKRRVQDAENKSCSKEAESTAKKDLQDAIDRLERIKEEIGKPQEFLASDVTPEKIPDILEGCGFRGITMYSSEAMEIINIASGIYSGGVVRIDHILKGHDGEDIEIKRKNVPDVNIENAVIGFLGGIQPGALRMVNFEEFRQRGLPSRMHFIDPGPERRRTFEKEEMDPDVHDRFMAVMRKLTDFQPDAPHIFQPEKDTRAAVRKVRVRNEGLILAGEKYRLIHGTAKTAGEYAWRIAGLLATARAAEDQVDRDTQLRLPATTSAEEIRDGARITEEFLLPNDLLFAEGEAGAQVQADIELLKGLASKYGSDPISARDLQETLPRPHRGTKDRNALRERWLDMEFIKLGEKEPSGAKRFRIHPEIVGAALGDDK